MGPTRLHQVDALRGIAATAVALFHLKVLTVTGEGIFPRSLFVGRFVENLLWTCVDLFFVISGFIFAYVYLTTDHRLKAGTSASSYATARFARLYPLHILTLAVVAIVAWSAGPLPGEFQPPTIWYDSFDFLMNILFLQGSGFERGFSFNAPAWSLTSEAFCYLLFFALAKAGPKPLFIGSTILVIAGVAASLLDVSIFPVRLARGLVGFFIGVTVFRYKNHLIRPASWMLVAAMLVSLVVARKLFSIMNAGSAMGLLVWPWLLILSLKPPLASLLDARPFRLLGDLSYSIYLTHIPLLMILIAMHDRKLFDRLQLLYIAPFFIAAMLLTSWVSFRFFETPVRKAIRRMLAKPKSSLPVAAAIE